MDSTIPSHVQWEAAVAPAAPKDCVCAIHRRVMPRGTVGGRMTKEQVARGLQKRTSVSVPAQYPGTKVKKTRGANRRARTRTPTPLYIPMLHKYILIRIRPDSISSAPLLPQPSADTLHISSPHSHFGRVCVRIHAEHFPERICTPATVVRLSFGYVPVVQLLVSTW